MAELSNLFPSIDGEERKYVQDLLSQYSGKTVVDFATFYNARRRDPQTVLLTALLGFVGVSGVHRFYIDQMGMGLLFLLTGGLCGVGTILDLLRHKSLALQRNIEISEEILNQISFDNNSGPGLNVVHSPDIANKEPLRPDGDQIRNKVLTGLSGFYKGQQIPVNSEGILIGRDPAKCNLIVQSQSVSRQHAKISLGASPGIWILEDLDSTNGTYVFDNMDWKRIQAPVSLSVFPRFKLGDGEEEFELQ